MKKSFCGVPFWAVIMVVLMMVEVIVLGFNDYFNERIDPTNIYTMEAEVVNVTEGDWVSVWLENGHVYEFQRKGLEVGYVINVMMHDNCTPDDPTDDYPLY